ncbi:MAG: hypothetical protein ACRYF6_20290 [Janthinobacterium lividum]
MPGRQRHLLRHPLKRGNPARLFELALHHDFPLEAALRQALGDAPD